MPMALAAPAAIALIQKTQWKLSPDVMKPPAAGPLERK